MFIFRKHVLRAQQRVMQMEMLEPERLLEIQERLVLAMHVALVQMEQLEQLEQQQPYERVVFSQQQH